ncbi:MAG: hypothetical protein IJA58_06485 [Lachnospiraceae bacterium]|nr:hypothetical protein [Lachnospiraceae bacterium]
MADFTRFISYLYDYKQNTRSRNLGFAKVEVRQGMCRIGINLNHGQVLGRDMTLYGYVCEGEGVYLVSLGQMEKGSRERRWNFPLDRLSDRGVRLENLSGLILLCAERESFLLSVWNDGPWRAEDIRRGRLWGERSFLENESVLQNEPELQSDTFQENDSSLENESARRRETFQENESSLADEPSREAESSQESESILKNDSFPQKESSQERESFPQNDHTYPVSENWRNLCKLFPAARPFEPSAWEVLCISLQDIGRLPPENWVWGSNHFLLHGFYQYHHLILARQRNENRIYLGVPGEFGTNEKFMAGMFGLHQFQRERQNRGDKGYWLAPIRL